MKKQLLKIVLCFLGVLIILFIVYDLFIPKFSNTCNTYGPDYRTVKYKDETNSTVAIWACCPKNYKSIKDDCILSN